MTHFVPTPLTYPFRAFVTIKKSKNNINFMRLQQIGAQSVSLIHAPYVGLPLSSLSRKRRTFWSSLRGGSRTGHTPSSYSNIFASTDVGEEDKTPKTRLISFLTDVEGDRDYLNRFVEQSRVLCWRSLTAKEAADPPAERSMENRQTVHFPYSEYIDFINPESLDCLVYGGDVWDQGGFDLYVIRQLLHFYQRYPDRVYLIMGNRDMNKMRIISELGPPSNLNGSINAAPPHKGVYWLRGTGRVGDPDRDMLLSDHPVERLRWILGETMGSPRAFDYRKQELQHEMDNGRNETVTDEHVVESYRSSCHPVAGEMAQYLANAHLAVRIGEALFLHGALPLTDENLTGDMISWDDLSFSMPWIEPQMRPQDIGVHSIEDWLIALEDFCRSGVKTWQEMEHGEPLEQKWSLIGGYHNESVAPFRKLLQYGMGWTPDRRRNPTIVYQSWSTNGMPRRFFPDGNSTDQRFVNMTREFFLRSGVRLICSGHQPQGDLPNAIRLTVDGKPCWIVSGDTSYSGDTIWYNQTGRNLGRGDSLSGRGNIATSEVLILQDCRESGKILNVQFHGTLSDGTEYDTCSLYLEQSSSSLHSHLEVGTLASGPFVPDASKSPHNGPWWTRAAFLDGSYMLTAGEGFDVWNYVVKP